MALNTSHAHGGVVIYSGEFILLYCDDVEINMDGNHPQFKGSKKGRLYLTTHRMVFTNKDSKDLFQSFSFPFMTISGVELEQPVFGANYIRGKVKAQPNGNWTGAAKFKLHFKSGGAIEYGQALLTAAKMASRYTPQQEPPPYVAPTGPYYQAPPPAYTPPQGGFNGFQPPTYAFPNAPPQEMIFMTDQPPPYPGLNSGYNGYTGGAAGGGAAPPPGFKPMSSAEAKAQEAEQSAYYDPNNPYYAYMPPPQPNPPAYSQMPPSYDEATKKGQ